MIMIITISIFFLLFDGILTNFLPFLPQSLSLFTPMLTIILPFLLYPLFAGDDKKYYLFVFILGFVYDLFYTNFLFYDAILFLALGYFTIFIYQNLEIGKIRLLFYLTFMISLYEILFALPLFFFHLVPVTISKILYQISHSLLLNLILGEVLYLFICHLPKKYHQRKIHYFQRK